VKSNSGLTKKDVDHLLNLMKEDGVERKDGTSNKSRTSGFEGSNGESFAGCWQIEALENSKKKR